MKATNAEVWAGNVRFNIEAQGDSLYIVCATGARMIWTPVNRNTALITPAAESHWDDKQLYKDSGGLLGSNT